MAQEYEQLASHFFRHEAGKIIATLTKHFGFRNVQIAEDIVQETMIAALQHWQRKIPVNPRAWLYRVAKNKALDVVRRKQHFTNIQGEITYLEEQTLNDEQLSALDGIFDKKSIEDSTLQMLFACCHPALSEEMQIALALKTLCGLSIQEIANAFLTSKDTIEKRLYRAKERVRESGVAVEFPREQDLENRLNAVLHVLYLLFNEGYNSSHPDMLIRQDLCDEAQRLCGLLLEHPLCAAPQTNALMALMYFQASRFSARLKESGELVMLSEQVREVWNNEHIAEATRYLVASARGETMSRYHIEAGIAAQYALAPTFADIHWHEVDKLYEILLRLAPSELTQLNRIVVRSYLRSLDEVLQDLGGLENALEKHYLFHATKGTLLKRKGEPELAKEAFLRAASLTQSVSERAFLLAQSEETA